jgi:hypothetical protein
MHCDDCGQDVTPVTDCPVCLDNIEQAYFLACELIDNCHGWPSDYWEKAKKFKEMREKLAWFKPLQLADPVSQ